MKFKTLVFFALVSIAIAQAQYRITPYVSSGVIAHLGKFGLNTEVGVAMNFNRLALGIHYRQSSLSQGEAGHVSILAVTPNISLIIVKDETSMLTL